jgi:hypothetical protein
MLQMDSIDLVHMQGSQQLNNSELQTFVSVLVKCYSMQSLEACVPMGRHHSWATSYSVIQV